MPYTAEPPIAERARNFARASPAGESTSIPTDRPSPRGRFDPGASGAHWDIPEWQDEKWPRERSLEHKMLPPVFGTST